MNKLIKELVVTGLALATFSVTPTKANANFRSHQPVPKSLRGTWYSKKSLSKNSEVKFTRNTFTTWSGKYKEIGSNKVKKNNQQHGKTFTGKLWVENEKHGWYSFEVGNFYEVPAWRYTHAYLRHNGKSHRYPAVERSFSYLFGREGGATPKNVYFFKASAWK
ncbi:hypothetical protein [Secundilactobacillus yichangensis]|uniref:hypothetical protein n=1 Tax=Secundilactobacillus yichangensis TaxID=2799580 RepID=UPI0019403F3C|nr:hypothetical protein [Secundilactobacillus yichangensis]